MKKYTKEELFKMDAVDVYKLVLEKKYIKKFPDGFWKQPEALDNAVRCIKYLIEDLLKLSDEELKNEFSQKMFTSNALRGMLKHCFHNSIFNAIEYAYPNKFNFWEFNVKPQGFWDDIENCKKAIYWLVEDKMKLSDEELKNQLSLKMFKDNKLDAMLSMKFHHSPVEAIQLAYPGKFYPWEFKQVPQGYWTTENKISAVKWLIEEKLKLSDEELLASNLYYLFQNNGLLGLIHASEANYSAYELINLAYPGKFLPWQFKYVPSGYWNEETATKAIRWLIEVKLKLSDEEIMEQLSQDLFEKNGLNGMLSSCFNSSPYEAINCAYPNKYYPWQFKNIKRGYWCKETGILATKWLCETKLKLSDDQIKSKLSAKLFEENGLSSMLKYCFNSSPYEAISESYPERNYKKEDFKNYNRVK